MIFNKRQSPMDFGTFRAIPVPEASAERPGRQPAVVQAEGVSPVAEPPLEPPAAGPLVAADTPKTPARRAGRGASSAQDGGVQMEAPPAWPIYLAAAGISVLWAFAPMAFAFGYRSGVAPLQNDVFALAVFALLALGPAVLVWGVAYLVRQAQLLAAENRRAQLRADLLLAPALGAAARAGDVVQGVRDEIERAGRAADDARETLSALQRALAHEAEQLAEKAAEASRSASDVSGSLRREREEMGALAHSLDAQASRVADSIGQQARMVSEAAELAQTQLREAEGVLAARAADLAAAGGEARDAARTAGEDLMRHIARLETAGTGVADQVRAVETGLTEQRGALTTLAQALRGDHEAFSAAAEAHAAKLGDFITQTRLSAAELNDRAAKGGEALKRLVTAAADQFRDLAETAKAEREEFGQSTLHALETMSQAASEQRGQLEVQTRQAIDALAAAADETREVAAAHALAARDQVEQLSEAAFAAGQKANQVFEARLGEARALIEQSSQVVEQAGAATAAKLSEGAAAARAALDELGAMMGEIEARARALPATARGQAEQVRAAVASGMSELMAQARRTAEEAQAIDAAFQERVRRNFDMLSEAVRLMGTVAAIPIAPAPVAPGPGPSAAQELASPEEHEELVLDEVAASPGAEALGLRPRLKLTPTATDEEFTSIFRASGGPADEEAEAEHGDGDWTWKDLLASLDGADADGEHLQAALAEAVAEMGVDPARLLPQARIDDIATVIQAGDLEGAREVVRKLAPAATRRIARRLATDDRLRRQVDIYVRRHHGLADDAAVRDPEGFLMAGHLASPAGRLYLLLDAAAGDTI